MTFCIVDRSLEPFGLDSKCKRFPRTTLYNTHKHERKRVRKEQNRKKKELLAGKEAKALSCGERSRNRPRPRLVHGWLHDRAIAAVLRIALDIPVTTWIRKV